MTKVEQDEGRRIAEAADWFTRLNTNHVATATLEDFFRWRRDPLNRAAYAEVEDVSGIARTLRGDPDMCVAIARARRPRSGGSRLGSVRSLVLAGGALAIACVVALVAFWPAAPGERYATAVGQQTSVALSDGSTMRLDTDSRVSVRYAPGVRRVAVEKGQAFFDVAHDPGRPFIVEADGAQVRAVGTRFDVLKQGRDVVVTLAEGRVLVTAAIGSGKRSWTLSPGQQLRLAAGMGEGRIVTADVETATAWTSGRLLFRDTALADAVAQINRYSRRKVILAAGVPGDVRINGAFDTGDVDAFAAAAAESLDLVANTQADGTVELRARKGGGG